MPQFTRQQLISPHQLHSQYIFIRSGTVREQHFKGQTIYNCRATILVHCRGRGLAQNWLILITSSVQPRSMSSLFLAPVNTTFPEAKISTDFMFGRLLYTTPGKFSFLTTYRYSHSFAICSLNPTSALATMFVIRKDFTPIVTLSAFSMARLAFWEASSASNSEEDPIMIMRPDLKQRTVLLGLVLRMMTAGKRFLLRRAPSTFCASSLRSISSQTMSSAKETTFWTVGVMGPWESVVRCRPRIDWVAQISYKSKSIYSPRPFLYGVVRDEQLSLGVSLHPRLFIPGQVLDASQTKYQSSSQAKYLMHPRLSTSLHPRLSTSLHLGRKLKQTALKQNILLFSSLLTCYN